MADLRARDVFEGAEDENLRWATEWDEADDALHASSLSLPVRIL